ncbi:MAG: DUF342 domain-containing protein [Oligoflexales bacterium]|nr:DUF342 domain-containing protein [Oligoflexales bacterium]
MAANTGIKLTYNQSLLRVRVSVNCGTLRQLAALPPDVLERTQKKMRIEIGKGSFVKFTSYASRFENLIKASKSPEYQDVPDDFAVHLTLAAGIPEIKGITFTPQAGRGFIGKINAQIKPKELQVVHPKAFYLFIKMLINQEKVKASPCEAQVTGIYNRLAVGEVLSDYALSENTSMDKRKIFGGAPFAFMPQDSQTQLKLVIFDVAPFQENNTITQLFSTLEAKTRILKVPATAWKNQIKADISLALHGIERFGLKMPISILAASPSTNSSQSGDNSNSSLQAETKAPRTSSAKAGGTAASTSSAPSASVTRAKSPDKPSGSPRPKVVEEYPGRGLLKIKLTVNSMQASISDFRSLFFEKPGLQINEAWFDKELKRLGIQNIHKGNYARAVDNIKRRRDINGIVIAEGRNGIAAAEPKIISRAEWEELKNKDKQSEEAKSEEQEVDHLMMRNKVSMVKKDEHVAELIFGTEAKEGEDVFGEAVPPPDPPPAEVEMDENVRSVETSFYANCEGVMKITGLQVSVVKTLIHEGDVNLASGNLHFDGPIVVQGSIETGAEVFTAKDLTVEGHIRGGSVYVGRTLSVKGGIITSKTGKIVCNGDVFADFLENSNIYAKGLVQVTKAVLSSKIRTLDSVLISNKDGIIAGSELCVGQSVDTGDLGFAQGRDTVVILGSNWIMEERLGINQNRLNYLVEDLEKTKLDLRELIRRNKNQMSKKLDERKANLQVRMSRLKHITEMLKERVSLVKKSIDYNDKSFIRVKGTLFPTCKVWVKDKEIAVPRGLEEIVIMASKHRQSHFIQIDKFDVKKETSQKKDKKAS